MNSKKLRKQYDAIHVGDVYIQNLNESNPYYTTWGSKVEIIDKRLNNEGVPYKKTMKKKNAYQKTLEYYRENLKKYIQEEEVRAALDVPLDKLNLNNVMYYSAYYHGARAALRLAADWFEPHLKGNDKVYVRAALELAMKDLRHTELFMNGQPMRYRNHEYKRKKLVKCEAYFYEEVKMRLEVEP